MGKKGRCDIGADLFINSIHDRAYAEYRPKFEAAVAKREALAFGTDEYAKAQEEVTAYYNQMYDDAQGYLRDSYNNSSLFWVLDLSWWNDVIPLLDDEAHLPLDKVAWLKHEIEQRSEIMEHKIAQHAPPFDGADREECIEYFRQKIKDFLAFFSRCLELQETPYCSL